MGKTLRNLCIASTNDFPGDKNDKIKGWIEHNGGIFSKDMSENVTHLLASQKAWKKYHPLVREARRLRTVHIVRLEWLEDSLLGKLKRPLETAQYAFEQRKLPTVKTKTTRKRKAAVAADDSADNPAKNTADENRTAGHRAAQVKRGKPSDKQQAKKRKIGKKMDKANMADVEEEDVVLNKDEQIEISGKEFDAACAEFEKDIGVLGYRPFVDNNGMAFLITLVRKDILKHRLEKHRLKVRYAPSFGCHHTTYYPMFPENPDRRRKISDDSLPSGIEENSLPRALRPSNPALRVHIPDPWAQALQLFEYDPALASKSAENAAGAKPQRPKFKSYACYFIYTRPGQRHVQMLAPPGSTFDFAWDMFRKFFKKRVGVDWEDRETAAQRSQTSPDDSKGEDGSNDRRWEFWGPLKAKLKEEGACAVGEEKLLPSVTVVMNTSDMAATGGIDARAKTPDGGW
ncbi:hypothetical protein ABEF93_007687 [Exophiala dermatitidis]